ncbi:MAG: PTS sugar transporter subunit IIA [Elusimicrobiaceae bacterium]|nr:PTS sugar transporter subunit IIA [Elusimicrobiaceae bacterium]
MEINSLKLNSKQVFLINNPTTKQNLVQYLVSNICAGTALDQEEVFKAIIKREQGISTTLESGLSIPHARLEGLTSFRAVVAVIPQGVQDDYGKNIKVMFLFLSPSGEQYFPEHLKLLAKLAETFTPAFIDELCSLSTVEEIAAELPL